MSHRTDFYSQFTFQRPLFPFSHTELNNLTLLNILLRCQKFCSVFGSSKDSVLVSSFSQALGEEATFTAIFICILSNSSFTFHHRAYQFAEQYNPVVTVFICELGSSLRIVNRLSAAADHWDEIWFSVRVDSVLFNTVSRRTLRPTQSPAWEYRWPFFGDKVVRICSYSPVNIQYRTSIKSATISLLHYTTLWTKNLKATNVIYIYGTHILDVSRSHTTTHHSR